MHICPSGDDADGWLDLFVVNSHAEQDVARWREAGDLPRSALFHNKGGTLTDVSRGSGANLALRGNGCVAADVDLDGHTDLYVTSNTYDALLWNRGDGTLSEIAQPAGIAAYGWHAGAAVGDVNGDGLPDIFVAGYTDPNAPIPGSFAGFPTNHRGVRDLLYLNLGTDRSGPPRFREVGELAGVDPGEPEHGLGAMVSDLDGDGRLDVYVANDEDQNRLYRNVPWPGGVAADPAGLGFRLRDVALRAGVADANAGMGIAAADYDGNGLTDLFVSNSRGQGHAVYRRMPTGSGATGYADARDDFVDTPTLTGWGGSWVDLDLDTDRPHPDERRHPGHEPDRRCGTDPDPGEPVDRRGTAVHGPGTPGRRRGQAADERTRPGGGRLRQRRGPGRRDQLDRRAADPAREHRERSELAVRSAARVLAGGAGHCRVAGRAQAGPAGAGGRELPLVRGPPPAVGLGDAARVRTLVIQYPDGTGRVLSRVGGTRTLRTRPIPRSAVILFAA